MVRKSDFELIAGDDAKDALWFEIDSLPPLAFDHAEIIEKARAHIREVLKSRPIIFKLLDKKFTIPELQRLYEINQTARHTTVVISTKKWHRPATLSKQKLRQGHLPATRARLNG